MVRPLSFLQFFHIIFNLLPYFSSHCCYSLLFSWFFSSLFSVFPSCDTTSLLSSMSYFLTFQYFRQSFFTHCYLSFYIPSVFPFLILLSVIFPSSNLLLISCTVSPFSLPPLPLCFSFFRSSRLHLTVTFAHLSQRNIRICEH